MLLIPSHAALRHEKDGSGVGLWPALPRPKHVYLKSFLQSFCPGSHWPHDSVTGKKRAEQNSPGQGKTLCFKIAEM